ncbi:cilia- and flagella-associated protein 107 [Denticeps clupeoides]|uniref:Uncharacterized protein n=1 Tax=Denticeps clupeoides TaxID=299321 RepID=A0AAY4EQN6_9TELE|nr:uncharacterized protein C1orf158 homolog [Denticeps clupeoides]
MMAKGESSNKWMQPGWRVEQKYANKVLIGNWAEDRLQFTRECRTASSSNRLDYRPQWDHRPDISMRQRALRKGEGLPAKLLLAHHNTPSSHYLVSLYDETYGRRSCAALPKMRSWHSDKLGWVPERSDHPVTAPATNFGLAERVQARLERQQHWQGRPATSVYRATYPRHPVSAFQQPRRSGLRPIHLTSPDLQRTLQPRRLTAADTPDREIPSI